MNRYTPFPAPCLVVTSWLVLSIFIKKSLATFLTYLFREAIVLTYPFQYDGGGNGVADEERKEVDTEA